jgi:hypothetical protein
MAVSLWLRNLPLATQQCQRVRAGGSAFLMHVQAACVAHLPTQGLLETCVCHVCAQRWPARCARTRDAHCPALPGHFLTTNSEIR